MGMEYAFLEAMKANPRSRLAPRVKKAFQHQRASPSDSEEPCGCRECQALAYSWRQLGRAWADLQMGGCAWLGPIDRLRGRWRDLVGQTRAQQPELTPAQLLWEFAHGAGLTKAALDQRGRDYLMRLFAARAGDAAQLCKIEGVRWLSPATLLYEAVTDVADHSPHERQALVDSLSDGASEPAELDAAALLLRVCRALAGWLEDEPQALRRGR